MKFTLHHEYDSLADLKADIESMARAFGLLDDQRAERMAAKRVFQETEKVTLDEAVAAVVSEDKAKSNMADTPPEKPVEAIPAEKAPKAQRTKKAAVAPDAHEEKGNGAAEPEIKPISHEDLVKVMAAYQNLYGYAAVEADSKKVLRDIAGVDRLSRLPKGDLLMYDSVYAALSRMLNDNPFGREAARA